MHVRITHAKARWPEGARVGDTHEFDGAMPAWALGKCVVVGEPAKAEPSAAEVAQEFAALAQHHETAVSALKSDLAEVRAECDEAQVELKASRLAFDAVRKQLDEVTAHAQVLAAQLAEAHAAPAQKPDHKPKKGG